MFLCTGFQSYLYHTRLGEFEQVIYCVWASMVLPKNGGIMPPKMVIEGLDEDNTHKTFSKTFGS